MLLLDVVVNIADMGMINRVYLPASAKSTLLNTMNSHVQYIENT